MSYVAIVTYVVKDGEADAVRAALEAMVPRTRAEPGCISYRAHASVEDPNVFILYEEYVDADASKAHAETPHFDRCIRGETWPRVESRTVVRAEPIG